MSTMTPKTFQFHKLADDLIIGAERIGAEIGATRRQTQHLIDRKALPGVFKFRGKWTARRSRLRKFFDELEAQRKSPGGEAA